MNQDIIMKISDKISDQLISIYHREGVREKTILELYRELLEPKYQEYYNDVLTYIPERLAAKGYEIVNSHYFELRKY